MNRTDTLVARCATGTVGSGTKTSTLELVYAVLPPANILQRITVARNSVSGIHIFRYFGVLGSLKDHPFGIRRS